MGLGLLFAAKLYRLRPRFEGELLRESWKTARWAYAFSLLTELNARFGFVILIPAVLAHSTLLPEEGKHELGLFGTTLAFADILRALLAVELILFAEIAGERERSREITPAVSRLISGLGACAVLGASVGAPFVLWVVNADYLDALPALFVLLPGTVALAVAKALSADLLIRGQERWILGNHLAGFVAIVLVHLLSVGRLGALGMALGLSAGYVLQAARAIARYSRVAGVPARDLILPTRSDWTRCRDWIRRSRIGAVDGASR
ncbi:MAG: hypothetical protein IPN34_21020 [Planctomycetes bacterium]|nr:hypothetical protein [Planctomycetota bacterium]